MDFFQKVNEDIFESRDCEIDFSEAKRVVIDTESTAYILFS